MAPSGRQRPARAIAVQLEHQRLGGADVGQAPGFGVGGVGALLFRAQKVFRLALFVDVVHEPGDDHSTGRL